MKKIIFAIICTMIVVVTMNAKPRCQGFNNYNDKVTIVLSDDKAGDKYTVSEAVLSTCGKRYGAISVKTELHDGTATLTLTFPHITHFSNPKIALCLNGKKIKVKVCQ